MNKTLFYSHNHAYILYEKIAPLTMSPVVHCILYNYTMSYCMLFPGTALERILQTETLTKLFESIHTHFHMKETSHSTAHQTEFF